MNVVVVDRSEERSVIVGQLWLFDLAAQYAELVAEDDELEVFRSAGARVRRANEVRNRKRMLNMRTKDAVHCAWSAPTTE